MAFDTINYFIFFVLFVFTYWTIPHKYRLGLMLIGSYYFYSCINLYYIFLMIFSTLVDFYCSHKIHQEKNKRTYLLISIFSNLTLLSIFKYLDFAIETANSLFTFAGINLHLTAPHLAFPIGISFYTLQTMSYTFDVYKGLIPPEKNIFRFGLFVCFFPQLVAGPLERAGKLLPQFRRKLKFDYSQATEGLVIIMWGLIKKTIVSDRLHIIIADVYENKYGNYSGIHHIFIAFLIAGKFYCDFSGYSDMAIGSAKILGIQLSRNFDFTFWSTSITRIWRRWHITLYKWFHDYVYMNFSFNPDNRKDPLRLLAILVVFFLSGLWHGPSWTFIIWGTLNGIFCIFHVLTRNTRKKIGIKLGMSFIPKSLRTVNAIFITNVLVAFTMIFFQAKTLTQAWSFINVIINRTSLLSFNDFFAAFAYLQKDLVIAVSFLVLIELCNFARFKKMKFSYYQNWPTALRFALYFLMTVAFLLFSYEQKAQFSYFYY